MSSSTPATHVLTPEAPRSAWRRGLTGRVALVALGATLAGAAFSREPRVSRGDRRVGVAEILKSRGFAVEPDDVVFVDGPRGLFAAAAGRSRLLVRARGPVTAESPEDAPTDVFLFEARLSPSGALLDLSGDYNLSETTGADETRPVVFGERAAFASVSEVSGAPSVVTVLDFAGQPKQPWPLLERTQQAVTNLQQTGRLGGVGRATFTVTANSSVVVGVDTGGFNVQADGAVAKLTLEPDSSLPSWITRDPIEVARPGNLVTWSVDRVRLEIGDERMQAIKQTFFEAKDFFDRNKDELTGATGEEDIAEDLGEELGAPHREIPVDPDLGWPPAPLEPWVTPALPGEGQWNQKDDAAFFRSQPNLPPTFLTTFVRTDRTRKTTRVYITLWDPRQVELHMMAGTVEPKGATGKAGPGLIPRTPDVMKRVVAATNAGFQALHGEYGMMADGVVYLPPKPYAATVMKLRDGSTGFGTWPKEATVPDDVVSYRQNMTVMVQDEKFNPYNRTWWGGTVPGAEDKTHTVRTGICLTKEGFVAYFYGADLSPEALAQAMIQTRCSYGLALDMNAGHSGLEFYKVAPSGELPSLGRPLETSWEAEGDVPDMPGWSFRSKRMIKGMGLMNFPRYIKRESRDFFYLTLRHVLPGENLPVTVEPALEGEGTWRVKGLPQHGFPYALALSELRPDKADPKLKVRVLAVDPRTVRGAAVQAGAKDAAKDASSGNDVLFIDGAAGKDAPRKLFLDAAGFIVADQPPSKTALLLAGGAAALSGKASTGAAMLCVHDESSMLYYAEVEGAASADLSSVQRLFTALGCSESLLLAAPLPIVLGDNTTLTGEATHPPRGADVVRLVRAAAPMGRRFFEDTPIVPRDEWYPLQQARVRYFKKHE